MCKMKTFECITGKKYNVPDKCCLVCKRCSDIYVDDNGPYAVCCDHTAATDIDKIEFLKDDSSYSLYDDCKLFEEDDV